MKELTTLKYESIGNTMADGDTRENTIIGETTMVGNETSPGIFEFIGNEESKENIFNDIANNSIISDLANCDIKTDASEYIKIRNVNGPLDEHLISMISELSIKVSEFSEQLRTIKTSKKFFKNILAALENAKYEEAQLFVKECALHILGEVDINYQNEDKLFKAMNKVFQSIIPRRKKNC